MAVIQRKVQSIETLTDEIINLKTSDEVLQSNIEIADNRAREAEALIDTNFNIAIDNAVKHNEEDALKKALIFG